MNINDILPAKREVEWANDSGKCIGYNQAINDCAAALSKHNLVVCPTEETIIPLVENFQKVEWLLANDHTDCDATIIARRYLFAKALLALLHRTGDERALLRGER